MHSVKNVFAWLSRQKFFTTVRGVSAPFKGWYWVLCHGWKPKKTVALCPSVFFLDTLFFVIPENTIWGFRWLQVCCDGWGNFSLLNGFRSLMESFMKVAEACGAHCFPSESPKESIKTPAWRRNSGCCFMAIVISWLLENIGGQLGQDKSCVCLPVFQVKGLLITY